MDKMGIWDIFETIVDRVNPALSGFYRMTTGSTFLIVVIVITALVIGVAMLFGVRFLISSLIGWLYGV